MPCRESERHCWCREVSPLSVPEHFRKTTEAALSAHWSGFTSITAAVGPLLGGFLIEYGSWRWVFFINLPLAFICLVLTFWGVPESRNPQATGRPDWPGAVLATVGLSGIIYALIESSQRGWEDPYLLAALLSGISALVAFAAVETYRSVPLLPLGLFRSRDFSGANLLTLRFLYSALTGLLFFFPLNLIQVQGYSATAAGASMLPFILLMFFLSRWSGALVDRYGARPPLVFGPVIVAVGFALFAVPTIGGSYWTTFFPCVVILGLGMATSVAPLTTTVMNSVSQDLAGTASGINNAVSRLAGVLSIAVLGVIMLGSFGRELSYRLEVIDVDPGVRQQIESQRVKLAAIEIPQNIDSRIRTKIRESIDRSFVTGFRLIMLIGSGLALLSALVAFLTIGANRHRA